MNITQVDLGSQALATWTQAAATVVLVFVTGWYVKRIGDMAEDTRLQVVQEDVMKVIAHGIDKLDDELDEVIKDVDAAVETVDEFGSIPELKGITGVQPEILNDLASFDESIVGQKQELDRVCDDYEEKREEAVDRIVDLMRDDIPENMVSKDIPPLGYEAATADQWAREMESAANVVAQEILSEEFSSWLRDYSSELERDWRTYGRTHDDVRPKLKELSELKSEIEERSESLQETLDEVREHLMDEYNIREAALLELK